MMLRKTTKPRAPEPAPAASPSLKEQIIAAQVAATEFVERKVQEIKDSPEGELLPIDWLRLNIRATTRAGGCACKAALSLLDRDGKT
jgi:hypothetical protein